MRLQSPTVLIPLVCHLYTGQAADTKETKPCQIHNPSNGKSYDLNTIAVQPLQNHKPAHKDDRTESWHARGYDYEKNFTMNFCAPAIEKLDDVVGVKEDLWRNVSAFYTIDKKTYSIGYVRQPTIVLLRFKSRSPSFRLHCLADNRLQNQSYGVISLFSIIPMVLLAAMRPRHCQREE